MIEISAFSITVQISDHFLLEKIFKHNDLSALRTFMHGSPPPHHFILGSVSTLKQDDHFTLKH